MKNFKVGLLILVSLPFTMQVHAQQNPREERSFGLSFYGGGPSLFASVSADYFVSSKVSVEAGGGAFGVYGGGRYHFKGDDPDKKWTFYTGLLYAHYGETVGVDQLFFLPLGYQYIGENGFNFAAEALILGDYGPYIIPIWPGIKFGYRF